MPDKPISFIPRKVLMEDRSPLVYTVWNGLCVLILSALFILLVVVAARGQSMDLSYSQDMREKVYVTKAVFGLPVKKGAFLLTPYGGWTTWAVIHTDRMSGNPFRDRYDYGARLEWRDFYVDFNHFCTHNVVSKERDGKSVPSKRWISPETYGVQGTYLTVGYKKTFHTIGE